MQKVIGEIFLDDVALVSQADDEFIDPMGAVYFHDMPDDGPPADLHHRLGTNHRLFGKARAHPACQDNCLHMSSRMLLALESMPRPSVASIEIAVLMIVLLQYARIAAS